MKITQNARLGNNEYCYEMIAFLHACYLLPALCVSEAMNAGWIFCSSSCSVCGLWSISAAMSSVVHQLLNFGLHMCLQTFAVILLFSTLAVIVWLLYSVIRYWYSC